MEINEHIIEETSTLQHIADDLKQAREAGNWEAVHIIEETVRSLIVSNKQWSYKSKKQTKAASSGNPNVRHCEKCSSILEKTDMRYDMWCPGCSKYIRVS